MTTPPIVSAFALGSCLLAQLPKAPPRLQVEPPGTVDLGSVGPAERKEQGYVFRNTSAAAISLRVLDLSPGVTVAGPALRGPIAPGAGAPLTLVFDPSGWQGFQTRNVKLETDDPGQGLYFLPLKAVIRPDVTVDGVRRDFGSVAGFESPQQVFLFTRETGQPLAIRIASTLPPYLEGEVRPDGNRSSLCFTLHPGLVPPGELLGLETVKVETNAPLQPAFDLYVGWKVHHAIQADPPRVVFQDPGRFEAELKLTATDGKPFRILKADVEGQDFKVERLPDQEAPVQVLSIRRLAVAHARAMLVLRFQGQDRELTIPLAYLPSMH